MKTFKGWMIDDVRFKHYPTRDIYLVKKHLKQFMDVASPKENPFRIIKVEVREQK